MATVEMQDWPEDTILPAQFPGTNPEGCPMRGVKGLMIAVLEDAIACLAAGNGNGVRTRLRAVAAARWVRSQDASWPFAFQTICDVLSIDAEKLRKHLLSIHAAGKARSGPRPPSARRVEVNLHRIVLPRRRSRRHQQQAAERVA